MKIGWKLYSVAFAAFVTFLIARAHHYENPISEARVLLVLFGWVLTSAGILAYAFDVDRGSRILWSIAIFAWLAVAFLNYAQALYWRPLDLADTSAVIALFMGSAFTLMNFVALFRLSKRFA